MTASEAAKSDYFAGRVALITGAASGIGLGLARALCRLGATVIAADIERGRLDDAATELRGGGGTMHPILLDTADRTAVYAAADELHARFGALDILANNAGVAYNAKPIYEAPDEMIDWCFGVNVLGVMNGVKAFVPAMIAAGRGGHIINTSSIGGFQVRPSEHWHQGLYAATKYAVTAISEALRQDLALYGIGVSILAPSAVATAIATSDRNRSDRFGGATSGSQQPIVADMLARTGMSPDLVGERVLQAIVDNEAYIFTHLEGLPLLEERHRKIEDAFAATRSFLASTGTSGWDRTSTPGDPRDN